MQGANLGATKQSKFFADPELTEISMRLYVPLLENDLVLNPFVIPNKSILARDPGALTWCNSGDTLD